MFSQATKLLPVSRCVQYSAVERCRKGCTSSLYITGDKTSESCAVLTPYVELDARFKNVDKLMKNLSSRGINIDVKQLQASWDKFQTLRNYKLELEKVRLSTNAKIKSALAQSSRNLDELKLEGMQIKDKIRIASKELWDVEKIAVIGGLSLPNDINPETPDGGSEKIVHMFKQQPVTDNNVPSHVEIASRLGLLEYYDSSYYFLKDDAAHFEMGISYLFMDRFREIGFVAMSNSDFGRSVVVEGVGLDPHDATSVFTLEKESDLKDAISRLHLVGGASLVSFAAYHTKTITNTKNLPLRYVTMGRHYNPDDNKGLHGLFSTWQSSAVESFVVTSDKDRAMEEFNSCLKETISLYESLGFHFRVEYLPPKSLRRWESLRASFQMFSRNMNQYIEVGSLSLCDDYISRRLLMCCETPNKVGQPLEFTHVVSGTLVSVPRILGCVLEYDSDCFKLPANVIAAAM